MSPDRSNSSTHEREPRPFLRAGLTPPAWCLLALLTWASCRTPTPDENVYTGLKTTGGQRPTSAGGSSGRGGTSSTGETPGANAPKGGSPTASGGDGSSEGGGGPPPEGEAGRPDAPDGPPPDRPSTEEPVNEPFSKPALLGAIARCTVDHTKEFVKLAEALEAAALAEQAESTPSRREATRRAWENAMSAWQLLEVFRFGPAARSAEEPTGGRDLRDPIYGWPLGGRCNIETQIEQSAYTSPEFGAALINVRGLGTLEYLLYYAGDDNACPSYSPLNRDGTWAALGATEIARRKVDYTVAVAKDVLAHARTLANTWAPEQGNYAGELTSAGDGSRTYGSLQAALNAVSNALFYVEKDVKDLKLALPLGLSPDCPSATCPEAVESPYSGRALANIRQNLEGFRQIFQGCGPEHRGLGFDDWLIAVGAPSLEERMRTALDATDAYLGELNAPLAELLTTNPESARTLYTRLKVVTDLLKTEFVSTLELELPASSEGDND